MMGTHSVISCGGFIADEELVMHTRFWTRSIVQSSILIIIIKDPVI